MFTLYVTIITHVQHPTNYIMQRAKKPPPVNLFKQVVYLFSYRKHTISLFLNPLTYYLEPQKATHNNGMSKEIWELQI